MARKVYITSEMSIDERLLNVAEEDPLAALIWPWILTALDDWGRSEAKPKKLKAKIFPGNDMVTPEVIEKALRLYDQEGIIQLYEVDGKPYMAVPKDKWFKYQTQIHSSKRDNDGSKFPPPPEQAENHDTTQQCAELREDARKIIPSTLPPFHPSTLPPFHPSPSIDVVVDSEPEEIETAPEPAEEPKALGTRAVDYAEKFWGRMIPPGQVESIIKWCDEFLTRGTLDPDALVIEAIRLTADARDKMKYLNSILRNWFEEGVLSVEHVKLRDEEFKRAREGRNRDPNRGSPSADEGASRPKQSRYPVKRVINGQEFPAGGV